MTNPQKQTKSFNVNCWLDVRTLASLVVYLDKNNAISSTSYSEVVSLCLKTLHYMLQPEGLKFINSTDQALRELQERGFSIKQLRSPSKLGKQLVLEDQEPNIGMLAGIKQNMLGPYKDQTRDSTPPEGASLPSDGLERALIQSSEHLDEYLRAQNEPQEREDSKNEPSE